MKSKTFGVIVMVSLAASGAGRVAAAHGGGGHGGGGHGGGGHGGGGHMGGGHMGGGHMGGGHVGGFGGGHVGGFGGARMGGFGGAHMGGTGGARMGGFSGARMGAVGGARGFGGGVQPRMASPGAGMGMARGGMGMGARPGTNIAGRSGGTSNFGRAGMGQFGQAGASNFGRAGMSNLGRSGINGGGAGMARNGFGVGARAPINGAALAGGANMFGRGGVNNGMRSGVNATSFNRGNLSSRSLNVNRASLSNNININNNRVGINNFNNNRVGFNSFGRGGFGGGFGRGFGGFGNGGFGFGGFGLGFGLGSLFGYGFGLGGYGLGYGGWYGGYGLGYGGFGGYGYGYSPWLYGSSLYDWGYSSYYNPYMYGGYGLSAFGYPSSTTVVVQPTVYDYAQPINTQAAPPEPAIADQVGTSFDSARDAFKNGDFARALELTDQAIRQMPNDAALHEFRGVVLFALHRYEEAAAPLYAVLAVGPGWDWGTLISLYPNVSVYTEQLRALEAYSKMNPEAAPARFVLAYLYMTQGNTDEAVAQLKRVVALQPKDTISARMVQRLETTSAPVGAVAADRLLDPAPAPRLDAPPDGPVKEGRLEGSWTAQPDQDTTIMLSFLDQGRFTWKVTHKGQDRLIQGKLTSGNGLLTLAQDKGAPMVGNVGWVDETHFTFKVPGSGPDDRGLSFTKAP